MNVGWEIVISGQNFDPKEFLHKSKIRPTQVWERDIESDGGSYKVQGIEFSDWYEYSYPLDMTTEAFGYIEMHLAEFKELCDLPGIDDRRLNFVSKCTRGGHGHMFEFSSSNMSMLSLLKVSASIYIYPCDNAVK